MSHEELVIELSQLHDKIQCVTASMDDNEYRKQYHSDLSPLGWHYGHIIYIENLWLRDTVLNQGMLKESDHQLYNPRNTPKHLRGRALAHNNVLLEQGQQQFNDNIALLNNLPTRFGKHRLMKGAYLLKFILQHHTLHLETMKMVITQKHIQGTMPSDNGCTLNGGGLKQAMQISKEPLLFESKRYQIGGRDNWSFDNELPHHSISLDSFAINRSPVSNAEYLGFMEAGGYQDEQYWSAEGFSWLQKSKVEAPDGWCYQNGWFQADPEGYQSINPDAAVCGICYHEAQAFANYANARLPHEYEREVSHPQLEKNTDTWEWCLNNFHPYSGFNSFPYREYSTPWFDKKHHVLRGGCRFNEVDLHLRASFRNFYEKHKRHIFSGIRLAYDIV